ncbi:HAD family phosphatase [Chlamydia crocodili]|uniref:HAD family phosphatase n=1 Tax=Chlamydia crocodili TaxID=2766982 RepID=A0ABX8CCG4_9CHLA|nr:HAD family phosphatase [Chlamydia crocodili]QVE48714.1 HAD family phosphatase [Chlamydia crocodili]
MNINDYQVFFFDLDGLVIDTEPLYYRAFLEASREYGLDVAMDFSTYYLFSMLGREVFKQKFLEIYPNTESFFPQCFHDRERIYRELIQTEVPSLFPGVEDFLGLLLAENKTVGVVTNSSEELVRHFRGVLPTLNRFQFWVTREDYERSKPYPDSYQHAYEAFVQEGEKVVGFEDSIKGLRALAGIPATLVAVNAISPLSRDSHEDFCEKDFHYFASFNELIAHSGLQNQL